MSYTQEVLLYGWAFFATVMAIMCAIGWRITWKALKRQWQRHPVRTHKPKMRRGAHHPQWVTRVVREVKPNDHR